jgi:hypothetical protein
MISRITFRFGSFLADPEDRRAAHAVERLDDHVAMLGDERADRIGLPRDDRRGDDARRISRSPSSRCCRGLRAAG